MLQQKYDEEAKLNNSLWNVMVTNCSNYWVSEQRAQQAPTLLHS